MKNTIRQIIEEIPVNTVFDSHTIIFKLMQDHADEYLSNFSNGSTELYNGKIGRIIAEFEGGSDIKLEKIGMSWSKNIKDKFSPCACWKKLN